ncbi:MAG: hypothetical protein QG555_1370 [Thermodesulfobacteriota bacterium]|nr:hypothetical protein [Thermodesulfobacteriota bacterium]
MKILPDRFSLVAFFLGVLLLLSGCTVATKSTVITPPIRDLFDGKYKVYPAMGKAKPRTVAVLPFTDLSRSQQGTQAVRRGFYNHFSSTTFRDMELWRVDDLLKKAGLTDAAMINRTPAKDLGKILGTDAIVYGEISNFDKIFAVVYSQVSVGAKLRMYDARTGELLWTGEHVARIHEGGISTNPIGLVATIIATAMNVRDIQLLRACHELFRGMVLTIPAPTIAEAKRPPAITILVQDTKNLPKKAGDEIRVVIQGTPKLQASFDIGEFKKHIDMQEQPNEPGVYLGVYRVVPGDNVRKAVITGYLADDAGNTSQWVDAVGSVTLKTTPPDKPKSVRLVGRNAAVLLSWERSADPDLAGYRVYRSRTPLSGYQEIARTEVTEFRDEKLANGQTYYYQLSAVDLAGNESDRAAGTGIPVAPGPTPVAGIIEKDTAWYAGASPYIIENTVIIKDQATLTIEAGTEVRSRGPALIVEGGLVAPGDVEHVISWDTATPGKSWEGIVIRNVKEKEISLKFNRVQNAATGLTLQSASPLVASCDLSLNATAVRISGAFAKPRLVKNTVLKNKKAAVVITDGAQPVVTENRIQDNLQEGILVDGAAPTISRNSIARNGASGMDVKNSQATITENNIVDNRPYNLAGAMTGESVSALIFWWGTAGGLEINATLKGRIDIRSVLSAPYPEGKSTPLPILGSSLGGPLKTDAYLTLSNSPYRITKNLTIDGGATLYIEPGVVLRYDQNTTIVVEDGGIIAKGAPENPIIFTASAASPSPGFYTSAVSWGKKTTVNSALTYAIIQYADIALDIAYGAPDISYSLISKNAQSGIYCRNDAAPTVSFSTLTENRGEGALTVVGNARPRFSNNNIFTNDFAAQVRSTIYIDARNNWWGKAPPDLNMIMGDTEQGINIKPWLTGPEGRAYAGEK